MWVPFKSSETKWKIFDLNWVDLFKINYDLDLWLIAHILYFKSQRIKLMILIKMLLSCCVQFRCDGAILSSCPGFLIIFRWLTICCWEKNKMILFFWKSSCLHHWMHKRNIPNVDNYFNQMKKHLLHVKQSWISVSVIWVWLKWISRMRFTQWMKAQSNDFRYKLLEKKMCSWRHLLNFQLSSTTYLLHSVVLYSLQAFVFMRCNIYRNNIEFIDVEKNWNLIGKKFMKALVIWARFKFSYK